jgi:hypothetical protein
MTIERAQPRIIPDEPKPAPPSQGDEQTTAYKRLTVRLPVDVDMQSLYDRFDRYLAGSSPYRQERFNRSIVIPTETHAKMTTEAEACGLTLNGFISRLLTDPALENQPEPLMNVLGDDDFDGTSAWPATKFHANKPPASDWTLSAQHGPITAIAPGPPIRTDRLLVDIDHHPVTFKTKIELTLEPNMVLTVIDTDLSQDGKHVGQVGFSRVGDYWVTLLGNWHKLPDGFEAHFTAAGQRELRCDRKLTIRYIQYADGSWSDGKLMK